MSTVEKGVLQPQKFSTKWNIERFFADCEKVGDSYTSQIFTMQYVAEVTRWSLQVYPKGDCEANKGYVSLYLGFESDDISEVTVDYTLSIVDKRNSLSRLVEEKTFKSPNLCWGWPKFVKQDFVNDVNNGALIDDTLTIFCEITLCPTTQDVTTKLKDYYDILNKIGKGFEDYEKLLENNYFSDVTFNIQDKKMYLHKAILMCRNSVFKAMFEHDMKEKKESSVDIMDADYEIMKELFRFIYSGKVENIEKVAKDLLMTADKYAVKELKALCEKTLCHNLTISNVIEYLKLTDMYDTIHLKTYTMNFVVAHYEEVVTKPEFEDLPRTIMCEIIRAVALKNNVV